MVGSPITVKCPLSSANPPVDTVSMEVDRPPVTNGDAVTVTCVCVMHACLHVNPSMVAGVCSTKTDNDSAVLMLHITIRI